MPAKVDAEKCTGCETCIGECPSEAITMAEEKAVIDEDACVDCVENFGIDHGSVLVLWRDVLQRLVDFSKQIHGPDPRIVSDDGGVLGVNVDAGFRLRYGDDEQPQVGTRVSRCRRHRGLDRVGVLLFDIRPHDPDGVHGSSVGSLERGIEDLFGRRGCRITRRCQKGRQ